MNHKPMSNRQIALQEYQDKVKSGEIERTVPKNPLEKWEEDKKSLRKSINSQCFVCMGGVDGDNVIKEIRECSSYSCTLREVRPYK